MQCEGKEHERQFGACTKESEQNAEIGTEKVCAKKQREKEKEEAQKIVITYCIRKDLC